jgi:hypothetical protein
LGLPLRVGPIFEGISSRTSFDTLIGYLKKHLNDFYEFLKIIQLTLVLILRRIAGAGKMEGE